jgi:hypothetical protein
MEKNKNILDESAVEADAPENLKAEVLASASAAKLFLEFLTLFSTTAGEALGSLMRTGKPPTKDEF